MFTKKQIEELLLKAYLETADRISIKLKTHPTVMQPYWERICRAYEVMKQLPETAEVCGLYEAIISCAEDYSDHNYHVNLDDAFSTILCEICIPHHSVEWYRIMAYHFERCAAQKEMREEREF